MSRHAKRALQLREGVEQQDEGPPLLRALRDNGLSLAFGTLFILSLIGDVVAGMAQQAEHPAGTSQVASWPAFMISSDFLRSVLVNWQAALLQLLALVWLARILRQRGAAHSRQPGPDRESAEEDAREHQRSWLYRHSFSLTFALLFLLTFAGFVLAEQAAYNAERQRMGEQPFDLWRMLGSARLWFDIFQTWQAEFFAMASFLVLSIFLREEDSSESKPIGSSDAQTGGTNE